MLEDATRREQRDLELLRRYHHQGDQAARDELARRFMPLVRTTARKYHRGAEPLEDLIQAGSIGLVKAIDRFDLDAGTRFVAFAMPNIQGEIRRHFRDHTWSVHVPRSLQELDARIADHQRHVHQTTGRDATVEEFAVALGETPERIVEGMTAGAGYRTLSIDHPTGEGRELLDTYGRDDVAFDAIEHRDVVEHAMNALDDRQRRIVQQRFYEERLQREIAEDVGVSQMQVSRLLSQSLERMHDHLEGTGLQLAA